MSMNDDSASRRGRRPEQGNQQWRPQEREQTQERWPQTPEGNADPYLNQRGREGDRAQSDRGYDNRKASYSNFSGHSYAPPPAPEAPPAPPQQRPREQVPPSSPPVQQNYYAEPAAQRESVREYQDTGFQNYPPLPPQQQAYEPEYQPSPYAQPGRDELFGREAAPPAYNSGYGEQNHSRNDAYDRPDVRQGAQALPRQFTSADDHSAFFGKDTASPLDDYERNSFTARIGAHDSQASRFYLPEDRTLQPQQPYAPERNYGTDEYDPAGTHRQQAPAYQADAYGRDAREQWQDSIHDARSHDLRSGVPSRLPPQNELDEDFFADEDELDHDDHAQPKKSRKKLMMAAVAGAVAIGGTGAYFYKSVIGGSETATPVIRADNKPIKESPANPGGRQFANGEKAIYDRLTPQGPTTVSAAITPQAGAQPRPANAPSGNSLEDRIEEALRKSQAAGGSAAPASAPRSGADQPTVVASERYGPDGKRIDPAVRTAGTPSISGFTTGQLPPPFGSAQPAPSGAPFAAPPQQNTPAPFRTASGPSPMGQTLPAAKPAAPAPSAPAPARATTSASFTPSAPAAAASGFYVQIKSSQDEKAAAKELPSLTEKYASVLGDTQLATKTVDLGDKGVWFRVVAGPLPSKDAAMALCTKMKAANLQCVVPRE